MSRQKVFELGCRLKKDLRWIAAPETHVNGGSDSKRHLGVLADREDATDGRHDRVEAPEGHKEARNEAGEAGYIYMYI